MIKRDKQRNFNNKQRNALFVFADGKCALCDCPLVDANWHPDHIKPWHLGGKTDVVNGQALCIKCNLQKGGKYE